MTENGTGWVKKQIYQWRGSNAVAVKDALALENEQTAEYLRQLKADCRERHPEWFEPKDTA